MRLKSRRRSRSSSVLLLAAGALAGLAVGALLSDRVGGVDALLPRGKGKRKAKLVSRERPEQVDEGIDDGVDEAELDHAFAHESAEHALADHKMPQHHSAMGGTRRASPDEATLEARVLEAFHNDPILRERAIDIGAIGTGVIELTGWVQTRMEINHAITLARGVPDVSTVVDRLAVREVAQRREHRDARSMSDMPVVDVPNSAQPPRAD